MIKCSQRRIELRVAALTAILAVFTALTFSGCRQRNSWEPQVRPSGVPSNAKWVEGAGGGAYISCTVDRVNDLNACKILNSFTGQVIDSGNYRLVNEKRAAKESELQIIGSNFAGSIFLEGGLVLRRL